MNRIYAALISASCAALGLQQARAVTVDELGSGPSEVVTIQVTGLGKLKVDAGVLKLNVGGVFTDGFCIDPFHFSAGSMSGYQIVDLTSAPKDHFMSATTALELERLWGSYYSPNMGSTEAAGLQIAFWELTGGSGFKLCSNNDFGAAGFLSAVQDPNYSGPVTGLVGLTGPGQDYAVQDASVNQLAVHIPDVSSTLALLTLALCGLKAASCKTPRLAPIRNTRQLPRSFKKTGSAARSGIRAV